MGDLKESLKRIPALVALKRTVWSMFGADVYASTHNVLQEFPIFRPFSSGSYKALGPLTVQAANQSFPFMADLAQSVAAHPIAAIDVETMPKTEMERQAVERLKKSLDGYGSDKADRHNYHFLYATLLANSDEISAVFEVGLGTNNTDVASSMGKDGRPGASLRAFRDFCPNAKVYGADIDSRVLFTEERIETFFVDQTDPSSFEAIKTQIPEGFDLIVDDGLHSPNANLATLKFALEQIKVGGWAVIEDIPMEAKPVWEIVAAFLPRDKYEPVLLQARSVLMFAVQRLS